MVSWQETNWFAIQAKPCREKPASARLSLLNGVEVFYPERTAFKVCGLISSRHEVKPLFPGYFFARFCPFFSLDLVRYANGVLRVVGTHLSPVPVADEIITAIRALVEEDGYVRLAPRVLHSGDRVCVNSGPLEGTYAKFEQEWDDGRRVAILLETIQRARVLINRESLVTE